MVLGTGKGRHGNEYALLERNFRFQNFGGKSFFARANQEDACVLVAPCLTGMVSSLVSFVKDAKRETVLKDPPRM